MARVGFRAMNASIHLVVPDGTQDQARDVAATLFAHWEEELSRFRPGSGLSRLNAAGGTRPIEVSPLLFRVVARAVEAARATHGVFDPTVLRDLEQLGYDRSFELLTRPGGPETERVPVSGPPRFPSTPPQALTSRAGWRDIRLDPERGTIQLPPGSGIDLGGIAKGMAVDATIGQLADLGIRVAMVEAGGDLRVAGLPGDRTGWPISVPSGDGDTTIVPLAAGAMATSGIAKRRWVKDGRVRHHLLDPRTGRPATTGLWSVTAVASTCAQAEVAAKTAFVLGRVAGTGFIRAKGLAALFVPASGQAVAVGGWPAGRAGAC
jgi:thiamine biosynthesis lipoprotein